MSIFTRYTLQTLKKNRTRTLVTIIGIILSVAMFTAVTESIYSGMQYLIRVTEATDGKYHGFQVDVNAETLTQMKRSGEFTALHTLQGIGYAEIDSKNEYKPYLYLAGIDEGFEDLVAVRLTEGRMPQTDGEIVLPRHLETNGRVTHKLGDTLVLQIGRRESEGSVLDQSTSFISEENGGESIVNAVEKTYTVVGFCERPKYTIERTDAPGYTAYVKADPQSKAAATVFFTVPDPRAFVASGSGNTGVTSFGTAYLNTDLMMFMGYNTGSTYLAVVYGLGAVLMAIIMVGSIALIYNSFSISVSERTKQFGLLRSIGATKKQMLRTVLTEGLLLSAAGIPLGLLSGCAGIAVTFRCLQSEFATIVTQSANVPGVTMRLIPNVPALAAAAAVSLLTTLISAYIPVRRALKISAIDAIRQSGDIKDKSRQKQKASLRTSRSTFGFSAMLARKNFRRSRKKYRITILSLALSLLLFISASSLTYYFRESLSFEVTERPYQLSSYFHTGELASEQEENIMRKLSAADGVKSALFRFSPSSMTFDLIADEGQISAFLDEMPNSDTKQALTATQMVFLDDASFRALCKENRLNTDAYFKEDEPTALLVDELQIGYQNESGKTVQKRVYVFKEQSYPAMLSFLKINLGEYDWLESVDFENQVAEFYKSEEEPHAQVPLADCTKAFSVRVGARLNESPYFVAGATYPILLYPACMREAVTAGEKTDWLCYGYFQSDNTEQSFEAMRKIADFSGGNVEIINEQAGKEELRAVMTLVKVFSYGFITLISLIAAANVFNTIYTNITLRRQELAMLRSVGLSNNGIRRMMDFESLIYGFYSLLLGLPASGAVTYLIYSFVNREYEIPFTLPWGNIAFAVSSIFLVVFASMLYATNRIKKDNPIDALKNENV